MTTDQLTAKRDRMSSRLAALREYVDSVSSAIKGPLPVVEKLMLQADREDCRREIASLERLLASVPREQL